MDLTKKECVPCQEGGHPLDGKLLADYISQLNFWLLVDNKLERKIEFKTFLEAISFVNVVAKLAEKENHHPDFYLHYNKLKLILYTHKIEGLTENDFILAAKINELTEKKV